MGFADFAGPLSSVLNIGGSFIENDWNKRAAQRAMDFSKNMSDTSYQRGVADLRAAGLNPMLAYTQGGASSPTGTSSSSSFDGGDIGHSARDLMRMKQEMAESKSREDLNRQTKLASIEEARKRHFEGDVAESQAWSAKLGLDIKKWLLEDFQGFSSKIPSKGVERFESGPRRDRSLESPHDKFKNWFRNNP